MTAAALRPRNGRRRRVAARPPVAIRVGALLGALAGVVALTLLLSATDVQRTAAWFTAGQTVAGNTVTAASVKVGGLGPDLDPTSRLRVANILPLTTAAALDGGKGAPLELVVRNTGTVPVDWTLGLTAVRTTNSATLDLAALVNVSTRVADGAWSVPVKLRDLRPIAGSALAPTAGASRAVVTVRFWFDPDVVNEAQGLSAEFTTDLKAIQTGAA